MAVGSWKTTSGPTSLTEEARLSGEYANWSNVVHSSVWITGPLDVLALKDAWRRVCLRHDALRRSYVSPVEARTHEDVMSEVEVYAADSDEEAVELLARVLGVPFDLFGKGFARVILVRRDAHRHLFGVALDHIITDETSWARMIADLEEFYQHGDAARVPEVGSYQDFASQLRQEFAGPWGERCREFWRSHTGDFGLFPPDFGLRGTTGASPSYRVLEHDLPANAQAAVGAFARQARATPFAVTSAGVLAGMREVSGESTVGLMAMNYGRILPGTARTVGLFVQGVPLHLTKKETAPRDVVEEVFLRGLDVFEHNLPLSVAERHWNEKFQAPAGKLGVFFQLNDGRPVVRRLTLAGTMSDRSVLDLPGGQPESPDSILVECHLGERSRYVATYNENTYSGTVVEQILHFASKFIS